MLAVISGFLVYISYMMSYEDPSIGCFKENNLTRKCNFGGYIDRTIFGKYVVNPSDPEGFFTTISAVVTTYFGYYFCLILKDNKN